MPRTKHPNKEIEKALQYAEQQGWIVEKAVGSAHSWGQMLCPTNNQCRGGLYCRKSIWSTPRNPVNHAMELRRLVNRCDMMEDEP